MNGSIPTITKIPKIAKYLNDIGVSEPIRERIEVVHSHIQKIIPSTIEDIFIVDYLEEDGTRVYQDMDFYSDKRLVSAMDFKRTVDIRTASILKIAFVQFLSKDYDFQLANSKSRLTVNFSVEYSDTIGGQLKATSQNCDYLMKIVQKYFIPRLKE